MLINNKDFKPGCDHELEPLTAKDCAILVKLQAGVQIRDLYGMWPAFNSVPSKERMIAEFQDGVYCLTCRTAYVSMQHPLYREIGVAVASFIGVGDPRDR